MFLDTLSFIFKTPLSTISRFLSVLSPAREHGGQFGIDRGTIFYSSLVDFANNAKHMNTRAERIFYNDT